jgi:carbon monoxide dehydrogenase subunit G
MRLENSFDVPAPPEAAWALLMDTPRVIPCMPGAELTEVVGDDEWKTKMAVKLGPISMTFAAKVTREEANAEARRVRLVADARETKGKGAARATIESSLTPAANGGGTHVAIVTDLSLSGPVAQYGRGMVQDVSAQMIDRFAGCLARQLEAEMAQAEAAPAARAEAEAAIAEAQRPVKGLRLGVMAILRALGRLLRRPFRRRTA